MIAVLPDSGGRGNAGFAALRRLSAAAAKARAALVIVVRGTPQAAPANPRLREISAGGAPVPMLAVWDPAARSALDAKGDVTVSAHMAAPAMTPVKLRNVIGILRGSDPTLRNTYVLLTAHYDHLGCAAPARATTSITKPMTMPAARLRWWNWRRRWPRCRSAPNAASSL